MEDTVVRHFMSKHPVLQPVPQTEHCAQYQDTILNFRDHSVFRAPNTFLQLWEDNQHNPNNRGRASANTTTLNTSTPENQMNAVVAANTNANSNNSTTTISCGENNISFQFPRGNHASSTSSAGTNTEEPKSKTQGSNTSTYSSTNSSPRRDSNKEHRRPRVVINNTFHSSSPGGFLLHHNFNIHWNQHSNAANTSNAGSNTTSTGSNTNTTSTATTGSNTSTTATASTGCNTTSVNAASGLFPRPKFFSEFSFQPPRTAWDEDVDSKVDLKNKNDSKALENKTTEITAFKYMKNMSDSFMAPSESTLVQPFTPLPPTLSNTSLNNLMANSLVMCPWASKSSPNNHSALGSMQAIANQPHNSSESYESDFEAETTSESELEREMQKEINAAWTAARAEMKRESQRIVAEHKAITANDEDAIDAVMIPRESSDDEPIPDLIIVDDELVMVSNVERQYAEGWIVLCE